MIRREFVKVAGSWTGGWFFQRTIPTREFHKNDDDTGWQNIRSQFALPADYAYLNTGGLGATPTPVLESVTHAMHKSEIYPRPGHDLERWKTMKEACAQFLGINDGWKSVAFTNSATEGINIILNGLPWKAGDEVITSTHEHPALIIPLLNMKERRGIIIRAFEPDRRDGHNNLRHIKRLTGRRTRLIFVSHVTCTTGQKMPVKQICSLARARGIWTALDGAQSAGLIPLNLAECPVDFYAASGHKWLLGPKRTGVLYVNPAQFGILNPSTVGAYSDRSHSLLKETLNWNPTAQRYEYATQNEALYIGLHRSIQFLNSIGMKKICDHNRNLADSFVKEMLRLRGITLLSPQEDQFRTSMVTFRVKDAKAQDIASKLLKSRIRVRVVNEANLNGIRVSWHLYNSEEEVQRILHEIKQIS
jgi:selenocysteine lyase/cysteine desulfurase